MDVGSRSLVLFCHFVSWMYFLWCIGTCVVLNIVWYAFVVDLSSGISCEGPFYQHNLSDTRAWICNYIKSFPWDVITNQCHNFNR